MTPHQISDILDEVQEAQHRVCVHLRVFLRTSSSAVLARLVEARKAESDLFKTVLTPERKPGFQPGHLGYRQGEDAANEA
jgi:hypothetical protein